MRILLTILASTFPLLAIQPAIYPTPQQVQLSEQSIKIARVDTQRDATMMPESYNISIQANGTLVLRHADDAGYFYALQTLDQLLGNAQVDRGVTTLQLEGKQLPSGQVFDAPDLPFRGTVEGFYGQPWSHEARLSQIRFYGRNKLNCYIYGPKDDPFHSARWREPYPAKEAAKIAEIARVAKENHVHFYWAIHPGHNIKWIDEDMQRVIEKFERMYALGVRSFAVFFDDISGEGTKPEMQAKLMNLLQKEFVDKKGDVGPLIVCPTQYNRAWSGGPYLSLLGQEVDKRIHIMWTGDTVVNDIHEQGQEWINAQLRRPAFIWWNSPTTDYVRDHLCLGRMYGNDQGPKMKSAMSGFTSNPMDKPEASKISLFGVADYSWNIEDFQSDANWRAGISRLFGTMGPSMQVIAEHNSDTGPNYHQYRREESVAIEPAVKAVIEASPATAEQITPLKAEFSRLEAAATHLIQEGQHPAFAEIAPWLEGNRLLGQAGTALMISMEKDNSLPQFVEAVAARTQLQKLDKTANQNPHQPGIKVGSRVLTPAVDELAERVGRNILESITRSNETGKGVAQTAPYGLSDIVGFADLPANINKDNIGLRPIQEVHPIPVNGVLELLLPLAPEVTGGRLNLGANALEGVEIAFLDEDGKPHLITPTSLGEGKGYDLPLPAKMTCQGLRLTNKGTTPLPVQLKEFLVWTKQLPVYEDARSLRDGRLTTALLVTQDMVGKPLAVKLPSGTKQMRVIGSVPIEGGSAKLIQSIPAAESITPTAEGILLEILPE